MVNGFALHCSFYVYLVMHSSFLDHLHVLAI